MHFTVHNDFKSMIIKLQISKVNFCNIQHEWKKKLRSLSESLNPWELGDNKDDISSMYF